MVPYFPGEALIGCRGNMSSEEPLGVAVEPSESLRVPKTQVVLGTPSRISTLTRFRWASRNSPTPEHAT